MGADGSRKRRLDSLRERLRTEGMTVVQIARRIAEEEGVNIRLAMRWTHGWTQQEVADRWNALFGDPQQVVTATRISAWENRPHGSGHHPNPENLSKLARVYGCAMEDLLDAPPMSVAEPPTVGHTAAISSLGAGGAATDGSASSPTLDVDLLRTWDELMRRRIFIAKTAAGAAPVYLPAATARPVPGAVDIDFVFGTYADLTAGYRRLDGLLGPVAVWPQVVEHHAQLSDWLGSGACTAGEVWRRAAALVVDAGVLLAWLAFDLDRCDEAAQVYRRMLPLARELGDVDAAAFLVGRMSRTLSECGHHREALAVADAAQQMAGTRVHPAVRSWLAVTRAHVHASLGGDGPCRADIDTAVRLLADAAADASPVGPYLAFYGEPYLRKWVGRSLILLAEQRLTTAGEGRSALDRALEAWSPSDVRESGDVLAACASGCLTQGNIDEAARLGGRAFDVAAATGSPRVHRYVRDLRRRLAPYRNTAAVRDLDEHILTRR